jgi:hypothetical protein
MTTRRLGNPCFVNGASGAPGRPSAGLWTAARPVTCARRLDQRIRPAAHRPFAPAHSPNACAHSPKNFNLFSIFVSKEGARGPNGHFEHEYHSGFWATDPSNSTDLRTHCKFSQSLAIRSEIFDEWHETLVLVRGHKDRLARIKCAVRNAGVAITVPSIWCMSSWCMSSAIGRHAVGLVCMSSFPACHVDFLDASPRTNTCIVTNLG